MSIDVAVFKTMRRLGASDDEAAEIAAEINAAIDRRYELHAKQLAKRGDLKEVEASIFKQIADSQGWTIGILVAGLGFIVAILKISP